jgi:hypothetical protein
MNLWADAIDRDGNAFGRAFESARECTLNPAARAELRRAVTELVASGALLPQEAHDFEDTLITSGGRLLNSTGALGLAE